MINFRIPSPFRSPTNDDFYTNDLSPSHISSLQFSHWNKMQMFKSNWIIKNIVLRWVGPWINYEWWNERKKRSLGNGIFNLLKEIKRKMLLTHVTPKPLRCDTISGNDVVDTRYLLSEHDGKHSAQSKASSISLSSPSTSIICDITVLHLSVFLMF